MYPDSRPEHINNFFRYCPHCGSDAFGAKSTKEMHCTACGFSFFQNAAAAVACIITDAEGRVLLTRRACDPWKGMLDLPGGFVDPAESVEEAVKRELMEELGAEVEQMHYICSYPNEYIYSNYLVYTIDLGFVCQISNILELKAADDVDKIMWFAPQQIPMESVAAPSIRRIIAFYTSTITN